MNDAAFLAAIRDEPDDDTPRLVYADWLQDQGRDDRAEFIRVQLELSRAGRDRGRRMELLRRLRALLRQHRREWLGPLEHLAPDAVFVRGFVEEIALEASVFLAQAEAILALHPITRLRLLQADRVLASLINCPHLDGVISLDLGDSSLRDAAGFVLAGCPYLGRLRTLDLEGVGLTATGAAALAKAATLPGLTELILARNRLGDSGAGVLATSLSLPRLTRLDLSGNHLTSPAAALLAGSPRLAGLTSLRLAYNVFRARDVEVLARSPHLAGLTVLDVTGNDLSPIDRRWLCQRLGARLVC